MAIAFQFNQYIRLGDPALSIFIEECRIRMPVSLALMEALGSHTVIHYSDCKYNFQSGKSVMKPSLPVRSPRPQIPLFPKDDAQIPI